MRKRSKQVHSMEASLTLQLTVSLFYPINNFLFTDSVKRGKIQLVSLCSIIRYV